MNALDVDAVYTEIWLNCQAPHGPDDAELILIEMPA